MNGTKVIFHSEKTRIFFLTIRPKFEFIIFFFYHYKLPETLFHVAIVLFVNKRDSKKYCLSIFQFNCILRVVKRIHFAIVPRCIFSI